jgi:flagellar biosynthetic protein FliR
MIDDLWSTFFCFFRIGPWFATVPLFVSVPIRLKASFAFILSIAVASVVKTPSPPQDIMQWIPLIVPEVIAGCFLGFFIRLLIMAMEMSGFLIGFQLNLSNASVFDPSSGTSNAVISSFLVLAATAVLFKSNIHYVLIKSLVSSYTWLPSLHDMQDMNKALLGGMIASLEVSVRLAIPVMIIGTLSYITIGILSRVLSGLQIFFVMIPGQILVNLLVFTSIIIPILKFFLIHMEDNLSIIVR